MTHPVNPNPAVSSPAVEDIGEVEKRLRVEIASFLTAIINSEKDFFLPNGSRLQHAAVNLLEALALPTAKGSTP